MKYLSHLVETACLLEYPLLNAHLESESGELQSCRAAKGTPDVLQRPVGPHRARIAHQLVELMSLALGVAGDCGELLQAL